MSVKPLWTSKDTHLAVPFPTISTPRLTLSTGFVVSLQNNLVVAFTIVRSVNGIFTVFEY